MGMPGCRLLRVACQISEFRGPSPLNDDPLDVCRVTLAVQAATMLPTGAKSMLEEWMVLDGKADEGRARDLVKGKKAVGGGVVFAASLMLEDEQAMAWSHPQVKSNLWVQARQDVRELARAISRTRCWYEGRWRGGLSPPAVMSLGFWRS